MEGDVFGFGVGVAAGVRLGVSAGRSGVAVGFRSGAEDLSEIFPLSIYLAAFELVISKSTVLFDGSFGGSICFPFRSIRSLSILAFE